MLVPLARLVFNRDERRTRAHALPPAIHTLHGRHVLMPTDPDGGGTWLAANSAGLMFALLNLTRTVSPGTSATGQRPSARRSRGQVITSLASCTTIDDAVVAGRSLAPDDFLPFRLIVLGVAETLEIVSEGRTCRMMRRPLGLPLLRTSSSLGDLRVAAPRRALFKRVFGSRPLFAAAQDAFHRHVWPARPEASVLMTRPDASTVSVTTVELYRDRLDMTYDAIGLGLTPTRLILPRA
jgi:hypothetical protein